MQGAQRLGSLLAWALALVAPAVTFAAVPTLKAGSVQNVQCLGSSYSCNGVDAAENRCVQLGKGMCPKSAFSGYNVCACGYVRDSSDRWYSMTEARSGCGNTVGYVSCGAHNPSNVWCCGYCNLYTNYIAPSSVLGWWGLDGNMNDKSGKGRHGSLYGNAAFVAASGRTGTHVLRTYGAGGTSASSTGYGILPGSVMSTGHITVSVWLKSMHVGYYGGVWNMVSKYSQFIMGPHGTNTNDMSFIVHKSNGEGWSYGNSYAVPDPNAWHHFVGTYNYQSGYAYLYVDGVHRGTKAGAPSSLSSETAPVHLGSRSCCAHGNFNGYMDEVLILSSYVSSSQAAAIYNSYTCGSTLSPTAYPTPQPSKFPTPYPTPLPTKFPTPMPTKFPTPVPTKFPTPVPTKFPTPVPTKFPTPVPTKFPTPLPTRNPTSRSPTTRNPTRNPTSRNPTSRSPTTRGPSTIHPTSGHPTSVHPTLSPTSMNPTTCGPTSRGPTTLGPVTAHPVTYVPTRVPTTGGPTTQSPTTLGPTTQGPTTGGPTTKGPTTLGPTTQGPTTGGPTTQGPTTQGPTSQGPTTANPTTCPTTDSPTMCPTTDSPTQAPTYTDCSGLTDALLPNVLPGSCAGTPHDTDCVYDCASGYTRACYAPAVRCMQAYWQVSSASACIPRSVITPPAEYEEAKGGFSSRYYVSVSQINNLCNLTLNLETSNPLLTVEPERIDFRRGLNPTQSFTLTADVFVTTSSIASLTFSLTGPSAAFVDTPAAEPISLGPGVTEYIPNLVSARVGNDYASVVFQFAKPTDQAGMVPGSPCTDILTDATVALMGSDPVCLWQPATEPAGSNSGSDTLVVRLGAGASFSLGSSVMIRNGVVRSANLLSPYANMSEPVYIALPDVLPDVEARVFGPQAVSNCSKFKLYGGSSIGGAGKALEYDWQVVRVNKTSGDVLHDYGTTNVTALRQRTAVFSADSWQVGDYVISLTVKNYLLQNHTLDWPIAVVGGQVPVIRAHAVNPLRMKYAKNFFLQANLDPGDCFENGNTTLKLLWRQLGPSEATGFNVSSDVLTGLTLNKYFVYLPSFTLLPNQIYGFRAEAYVTIDGVDLLTSKASIFLQADRQDVVACVNGGAGGVSTLHRALPLEADASCSIDLDGEESLEFAWTCSINGTQPCFDSATDRVTTNASTFVLQPSLLSIGSYTVSVTVSGAGGRTDTASTTVITTDSPAPRPAIAHGSFRPKYNRERVVLKATVTVGQTSEAIDPEDTSYAYEWSSETVDLNGAGVAATPLDFHTLVLLPGALQPGLTYSFALTVTDALGRSGVSQTVVNMNAPPAAGTCFGEPEVGFAVETKFSLECGGYIDTDVPLAYRFSLQKPGGSSFIQLTELQSANAFETVLPASPLGGRTMIRGEVVDALGYGVESTFGLNVSELVIPEDERAEYVDAAAEEFNSLIDKGDMRTLVVSYIATADVVDSIPPGGDREAARGLMLDAVSTLADMTIPDPEAHNTQLQMVERVSDTEGLAEDFRANAVALIERISTDNATSAGTKRGLARASLGSMSNIAQSLGLVNGSVDNETDYLAARFENILMTLSEAGADDKEPGEAASTIQGGSVSLSSRRLAGCGATNGAAGGDGSGTTSVSLPPRLVENATECGGGVVATTVVAPNWLPQANATLSKITGVALVTGGRGEPAVALQRLDAPLNFTMLRTGELPLGFKPQCRYYDFVNQNWTSDGCVTFDRINVSEPVVQCSCYRLAGASVANSGSTSSSSVRMTSFAIGFNAISADDITLDAFSYKNPIFMLLMCVLVVYGGVVFYTRKRDKREATLEKRLAFYAHQAHFEGVLSLSPSDVAQHVSFRRLFMWNLSRSHTWLSIFMRPEGDWMSSTARATLLLLVIFNTVAIAALFMGQSQQIGPLPPEIANALVVALMSFPIPLIVTKLFGCNKSKNRAFADEASRRARVVDMMRGSSRLDLGKRDARGQRRGALALEAGRIQQWEARRKQKLMDKQNETDCYAVSSYVVCGVWVLGCLFYTSVSAYALYTHGGMQVDIGGGLVIDRWVATVLGSWMTDVFTRVAVCAVTVMFFVFIQTQCLIGSARSRRARRRDFERVAGRTASRVRAGSAYGQRRPAALELKSLRRGSNFALTPAIGEVVGKRNHAKAVLLGAESSSDNSRDGSVGDGSVMGSVVSPLALSGFGPGTAQPQMANKALVSRPSGARSPSRLVRKGSSRRGLHREAVSGHAQDQKIRKLMRRHREKIRSRANSHRRKMSSQMKVEAAVSRRREQAKQKKQGAAGQSSDTSSTESDGAMLDRSKEKVIASPRLEQAKQKRQGVSGQSSETSSTESDGGASLASKSHIGNMSSYSIAL